MPGNTQNDLVSVIIPTYKRPAMLVRAIDSVIQQTHANMEIIVVDDNGEGTQEQTLTAQVAKAYKGSVTYLVHKENKGGSAARNTGWKAAHGQYILFLDDDDEIAESRIEKQVEVLEGLDDSWGACYTAYHLYMENGKIQRSATKKEGEVYLQALMRTLYMGSGSNLLLRKSAVDAVNGYDEAFVRNQDIEFMARVFEKYKLAYIDEDLLTIHMEVRQFKRSFEFIDGVALFYLQTFQERLNALSPKDRKRVISVISLERARVAIQYKKKKKALEILRENHVGVGSVARYACYIVNRLVTGKSYGFYLK